MCIFLCAPFVHGCVNCSAVILCSDERTAGEADIWLRTTPAEEAISQRWFEIQNVSLQKYSFCVMDSSVIIYYKSEIKDQILKMRRKCLLQVCVCGAQAPQQRDSSAVGRQERDPLPGELDCAGGRGKHRLTAQIKHNKHKALVTAADAPTAISKPLGSGSTVCVSFRFLVKRRESGRGLGTCGQDFTGFSPAD